MSAPACTATSGTSAKTTIPALNSTVIYYSDLHAGPGLVPGRYRGTGPPLEHSWSVAPSSIKFSISSPDPDPKRTQLALSLLVLAGWVCLAWPLALHPGVYFWALGSTFWPGRGC
jgi:hypothetical protein